MTGMKATSMRHVGMNRADMREAVKKRLAIGQQYMIEDRRGIKEDCKKTEYTRCTLMGFGRNFAVFCHTGKKITETVTYQELWKMLMADEMNR